jgi:tetratricopeptide (TPR) repeat protein
VVGRFSGAGMRHLPCARTGVLCVFLVACSASAVSADPKSALQNAAMLVQQGRLEEADQQARLALADPETRPVAYSVLGTIRVQQKKLAEGAIFLQKAIRLEPRLLGAHLTLAHIYAIQEKSQSAVQMYRRVFELDREAIKQSAEGLLVLITDDLKTGNREEAGELVKAWTAHPDTPQEWSIKLALLLIDKKMAADAIAVLEHARQQGTPSFELAFNLAGAYLVSGDLERALETYDLALSLNAQSLPALRQAAAVAEKRGELERSLSYWIRARKLTPNDPEVLLGFGRVCLKMDLLEDAEPALTKAAALKPAELSYQYTLAAAKVGKRQFDAARDIVEALLRARPNDAQLQYALGAILYTQGRLPDASTHLNESLRLHPDQLASRYYLALIARDEGRDAEAIRMLESLLQQYPDHAASCEALGGLLLSAQRFTDAEARLRTAVRLNPQSVKANYQLGLLLARIGRKEEADKLLALSKSLRQEDEATSRLQLRLLEPEQ